MAVGREGRAALPAPLLQAPARPERRQPRRAGRDRQDHGVLARARGLRLPGGRRALPHRDHQGRGGAGSPSGSPRLPARAACLPGPPLRRCDPPGRGEPLARAAATLRRRRGRRRAHDALRLHRDAAALPLPRAPRRSAARQGPPRPAAAPARLAVGDLRPQPRRADARQAHRATAPGGVRRLRSRSGHADLRARPASAPAHDARRRSPPDPDGVQPLVLAPGHARAVLRGGDRDGRGALRRGALSRQNDDAVVTRSQRRLLHRASVATGRTHRPGRVRARPTSTSRTNDGIRTRCSAS